MANARSASRAQQSGPPEPAALAVAIRRWTVRIAEAATADHVNIIAWTSQQFGLRQARTYAQTLSLALQYLAGGPSQPGIRARPEIGDDLLTLHVAGSGRPGRHLPLLCHRPGGLVMEVLRILHDGMDLPQHLPD